MPFRSVCRLLLCVLLCAGWFINPANAAVFTVTNTLGTGAGSLRQAILDANTLAGLDQIQFNIPGAGVQTIVPGAVLPDITDPVQIQGFTQPGAAPGTWLIEINGAGLINGLALMAGATGSSIEGLVVNRSNRGIYILNATGVTIRGCIVGLNPAGTVDFGGAWAAVEAENATGITIGGPAVADRNIVSGYNEVGLRLNNCDNVVVLNNYVGTDITGTLDLGNNQHGIWLYNGSNTGTIGSATAGNLVSGNGQHGIWVDNSPSPTIQGNRVGLNAAGTAMLINPATGLPVIFGNEFVGINIMNSASPIVGGAGANQGNHVSGNGQKGIHCFNSPNASVLGNLVGTDVTGNLDLGNGQLGIHIGPNSGNTVIGSPAAGNTISGNGQHGIFVETSPSVTLQNNKVGVNSAGTAVVTGGNGWFGMHLLNSSNSIIGGAGANEGNVFSGNAQDGARVENSGGTTIKGNRFGVNQAGTAMVANMWYGLRVINSPTIIIGGATVAEGNIISGNLEVGVTIINCPTNSVFSNNRVGTDITGTLDFGNNQTGVRVEVNSHNFTFTNNVISGNGQMGAFIVNSNSPLVQGNRIGVNAAGTAIIANGQHGIVIENSTSPIFGGNLPGQGNHVSGNTQMGFQATNVPGLVFKGNLIGTDVTGLLDFGNGQTGVQINVAAGAVFGGSTVADRNIISGNGTLPALGAHGISLGNSPNSIIQGNYIGLGADGTTPLMNTGHGIELHNASHNTQIGGALPGQGNVVGNCRFIGLQLIASNNLVIKGNLLGVDATGLTRQHIFESAVHIGDCDNVTVGGPTAAERNVLSGSGYCGLHVNGLSVNLVAQGNYVGTDITGNDTIPNWFSGIFVLDSSNFAVVGGPTLAHGNVCAGNGTPAQGGDGIRFEAVRGVTCQNNYAGIGADGATPLGNTWAGVSMNETILSFCFNNVISNNKNEGVYLRNAKANQLRNNFIGVAADGTTPAGNGCFGVRIEFDTDVNNIGGSPAWANIIAHNGFSNPFGPGPAGGGVLMPEADQNRFTYNSIYCNNGEGIDLAVVGANDDIPAPVITSSTANTISGTGFANGDTIHIYQNSGCECVCEGETFLGFAVVTGGAWTLTHNLALSPLAASRLTATETSATGSTSQFTACNIITLDLDPTLTDVSCAGADDGAIEETGVFAASATTEYTLLDNAGNPVTGVGPGGNPQVGTSYSFINLPAGTYELVAVSDGCTVTENYTLNAGGALALNPTLTDATCTGGTDGEISEVGVPGTGAGTTYDLVDALGNPVGATQTGTGYSFTGLAPGTYELTADNAGACTATQTYTIGVDNSVIFIGFDSEDLACNGGLPGSITVGAVNSITPANNVFSFTIAPDPNAQGAIASGQTFDNLPAGAYVVTATLTGFGCTHDTTITLSPTGQALQLNAPVLTQPVCGADGVIAVSASNGAAPVTFVLQPGNISPNALNEFTGLAVGNYTIEAEDADGCTATQTATLNAPTPLALAVVGTTDESCNGLEDAELEVSASGGDGTYTYSISPDPNAVSPSSSGAFTALPPGTYTVTVTDGCTPQGTAQQTVTLDSGPSIALAPITVDATCAGVDDGSIAEANVAGAVAGSTVFTLTDDAGVPTTDNDGNTSYDFQNLAAGDYVLEINSGGCLGQANVTVGVLNLITTDAFTVVQRTCGGDIDGTITVGAANLNTPANNNFRFTIAPDPNGAGTLLAGQTFVDLPVGTYTITITELSLAGCAHDTTITLTNTGQQLALDVPALTHPTCPANGQVVITPTNGAAPYTYTLLPVGTVQVNNGTFTGLSTGTYTLEVEDANGCEATTTASLNAPTALALQLVAATDETCLGAENGSIAVTATGGGTPYAFSLVPDPNGVSPSATGLFGSLAAGTYTVSVTDACNNTQTVPATLNPGPQLVADFNLANVTVTPATVYLPNALVQLQNLSSTTATQFTWTYGDGSVPVTEQNPTYVYTRPGEYEIMLVASVAGACADSHTVSIIVESTGLHIPNVFSPNGDNSNEVFTLFPRDVVESGTLTIFDRWGIVVYESETLEWGGKKGSVPCPEGVYVYLFDLKLKGGTAVQRTGTVTLLR